MIDTLTIMGTRGDLVTLLHRMADDIDRDGSAQTYFTNNYKGGVDISLSCEAMDDEPNLGITAEFS